MKQKEPYTIKSKCGAKTRTGVPCKSYAMTNGRCRMHGGKSTGAPPEKLKGKQNAISHGLFAKYLPKETLEIVNGIELIEPLDILYMNIKMQFASILRAQQIMYVKDISDHDTFTTKEKSDDFSTEESFEVHASWDKQATFMNSISRSMAELRSMIKQYIEMSDFKDDKVLEVEKMKMSIDKLKAETVKISGDDGVEYEDDGFLEAIKGTTDVWNDADD